MISRWPTTPGRELASVEITFMGHLCPSMLVVQHAKEKLELTRVAGLEDAVAT